MGKLYDLVKTLDGRLQHLPEQERFKVRGAISLKCGFVLSLVNEKAPDNPEQISQFRQAVKETLKLEL